MQKLQLLFFVLLVLRAEAQTDLLLLKKKGVTQKTFVKGSYIHFKFLNEQWIEGTIKEMRDDSIWVNMFSVRRAPDYFGFPKLDTSYYGLLKLHVKEIVAFPLPDKGFKYITGGGLFIAGGLAYIFLNIVNGFSTSQSLLDPVNLPRLGIAAAVVGFGITLGLLKEKEMHIGRKYSLQLISGIKKE
ncbi:MAG: hypothetical protein K2X26_09015 [Chitinophagaceae bacterium]|nr:hypothetical protein [Chitinophagaceae bacterium]